MSLFPGSCEDNKAIGYFKNEFTSFEYRLIQGDGGHFGFIHEISICDGSTRFATVKKTVAYVCIDEDDFGKPVIEKWKIKHIWSK